MSEKFKNKYRIKSARLQNWDYGSNAAYFVTICTKDRACYFGEVIEGKMQLNEIGKIAESEWLKTFEMRPDMNLEMGEYVVMPNHIHAIIGIGKNKYNTVCRNAMHCVPTNQFGPQSKNLASIIRGYKSSVKKYATINNIDFVWQPRFHDHIIRNDESFHRISEYIINNPLNWHFKNLGAQKL